MRAVHSGRSGCPRGALGRSGAATPSCTSFGRELSSWPLQLPPLYGKLARTRATAPSSRGEAEGGGAARNAPVRCEAHDGERAAVPCL